MCLFHAKNLVFIEHSYQCLVRPIGGECSDLPVKHKIHQRHTFSCTFIHPQMAMSAEADTNRVTIICRAPAARSPWCYSGVMLHRLVCKTAGECLFCNIQFMHRVSCERVKSNRLYCNQTTERRRLRLYYCSVRHVRHCSHRRQHIVLVPPRSFHLPEPLR